MEDFEKGKLYELKKFLLDGKAIDALYPVDGEGVRYFKAIIPVHFQGSNNMVMERIGEAVIEANNITQAYEKYDAIAEGKVKEMREKFEKEMQKAKGQKILGPSGMNPSDQLFKNLRGKQ